MTKFKFRAECSADAQAIRAIFLPWVHDWTETRDNLVHEGTVYPMPDVVVEFSIVEDGPYYEEMLWLIDGITDCHVAAETLAPVESYTGERSERERFGAPAQRPPKELMDQFLEAVQRRQQALNRELERAMQVRQTYANATRLGDKWQPHSPDEPSPGWLVVVGHKPTGLTSFRRISAPIGCKNWKKLEKRLVEGRFATIES